MSPRRPATYYERFSCTQMSDRQARTSDSFKMREKFKSSRRDATEERDGSVVSAEATMAAETATLRPMDIDYDRCAGPSDDADDPACDALAGDEETFIRDLCASWPGRKGPIESLVRALGDARDDHPPMYVHGPPVTGKTSIVRDVMRRSGRPHAYVSCVTEHSPKLLYEAVVEELEWFMREHSAALRDAAPDVAKKMLKCDRFSDLVEILRTHLPSSPSARAAYVVVDEAQRLLQWRGEPVLSALLRLAELSCRKVIVILIGDQGWDAFCSAAGATPHEGVYFPSYTREELRYVLLSERPMDADEMLYNSFLGTMLSTFTATCRNLHELRATLQPLWAQYIKPYEEAKSKGEALPEPRALYTALNARAKKPVGKDEIGIDSRREKPNVHTGLTVPLSPSALALGRGEWPVARDTVGSGAGGRLDFEIPRLTKFLLVAAYLCSHNTENVEKRLFGGQIEGHIAQRKRTDRTAQDREREAAAEAAVEGRRVFKLERLIAWFHFITRSAYDEDGAEVADLEEELLSADVFMQISSMTQLGMLSINRGSAMEGGLYQCNISRDLAQKLAQNLGVKLNTYLKFV
jgi:origin recognition complex subunit 5